MKNRLLWALGLVVLLCGAAGAQEVPVMKALLIIEDDYENPELNAISSGTKMDYGLVSQFLDNLGQTGVLKVEKTLIRGRTATKATVEGLIKNMRMSDKDIFFIYFSGHGGMEKKRTFLATAEEGTIWRDELEAMVKARPAQLKFIITDACSSNIEAMAPRGKLGGKAKEAGPNPFTEIYRHLFLNYKGMLHITAASEGEFAWSGDTGGLFTKSFFTEILLQNPKMSWEEIVKESQAKTQDKFSLMMNAGLFDKATVSDLDNRGIKTQKPMAYALPTPVSAGLSVTPVTPVVQAKVQVEISNLTKKPVAFVLAEDLSKAKTAFQAYTLKPGEKKPYTGASKSLFFFLGTTPKGDYYELTKGAFVLDLDEKGQVSLYDDDPTALAEAKDPMAGDWIWEEYWDVDLTKDFSMDELQPKYILDMAVDTKGTFVWSEDKKTVSGAWKVNSPGAKAVLVLSFTNKGKTDKEFYSVKGYGTDFLELRSQDDPSVLVYLSKKH